MNFGKTFEIKIPSIEEWAADSVLYNYATSIFTDESKTETGTGLGVFSDDLGTSVSLRLQFFKRKSMPSIWLQGKLDSFPFVLRLLIYCYIAVFALRDQVEMLIIA